MYAVKEFSPRRVTRSLTLRPIDWKAAIACETVSEGPGKFTADACDTTPSLRPVGKSMKGPPACILPASFRLLVYNQDSLTRFRLIHLRTDPGELLFLRSFHLD